MNSELRVMTENGERLFSCDATRAPRQGLIGVVNWALHHGGLRGAYLGRYGLLPGPMALTVGRQRIGNPLPGQGVYRAPVWLSVMRRGDDCVWREDSATTRKLTAELHTAA